MRTATITAIENLNRDLAHHAPSPVVSTLLAMTRDPDNLTSPIILASSSPRRRQLMTEAGYTFRVDAPDDSAECGVCAGENSAQLVARLAWQKAANVASRTPHGLVLAADTVADCRGQILGKPRDADHARQMLTLMSGQSHFVRTGVCLWRRPDNHHLIRVETTELYMDPLTPEQLDAFIASDQWAGKAGAFGYQDGLDWVHILKGESTNVVGLPMPVLAGMLAEITGGASQ